MFGLIIGGSGSGKSALAEQFLGGLTDVTQKYYLATMQVLDEEGRKKRKRHQKLREGKGFVTIEQPRNIALAADVMAGEREAKESAVLLECMSNLVANEMFADEIHTAEETTGKIVEDVRRLLEKVKHLIIVTNNVFEDGDHYEESTVEYLKALAAVNGRLAGKADRVVEVVAGIPVVLKEKTTKDGE